MPRPFTAFDRAVALDRLSAETFDVLVVGGGITGAGVALEAAARGLSTALVERDDFAAGTSSKSSKMVHGGLRYLQQREFALVRENLVERQRLLRNAPHLVQPLPFLVPLFGKGGVVDETIVRAYAVALFMYDLAGGWRIGRRHEKVTADDVYAHLPRLEKGRVVAGFLYYDARADDARLTLAILRTAVLGHGAVALNSAPVSELLKDDGGRVTGARVRTERGPIDVPAKVVVNASGVWADEVRSLESGVHPHSIRPAKGVHLTVRQEALPCDIAAVVPVPGDRRAVFVVPWGRHTYAGTTDTAYEGPLDDPPILDEDVDYILGALNAVVSEPIRRSDVTGAWAGLRPLLAERPGSRRALSERTADLSRRHSVLVSHGGLVTVTGGKLTTYRRMAEDTLDAVGQVLGRRLPKSPTRKLKIRGAEGLAGLSRPGAAARLGIDDAALAHLVGRYGGEAATVVGLAAERPDLLEPLVPGLPYLRAEAVYAVRYEMARGLLDVLARRTRAVLLDASAARGAAGEVAGLLGAELGWSAERVAEEAAGFEAFVDKEMSAGLGGAAGGAGEPAEAAR
jgi:glycerol-3-phosphate dehydrogenase